MVLTVLWYSPIDGNTVEPVLKDYHIGLKNVVSRQVVFGDRFIHTENVGPSAQNWWTFKTGVPHGQWSLETGLTVCSKVWHFGEQGF